MATIQQVTVFCDGPCGGTEIGSSSNQFSIRPQGLANRTVDLCNDCAGMLTETYRKGALTKAGRPKTRREVPARAASLEPTIIPMTSPASSPPMTVAPEAYQDSYIEPEPPVEVAQAVETPPAPAAATLAATAEVGVPADYDPAFDDNEGWSTAPEPVAEVPLGSGT